MLTPIRVLSSNTIDVMLIFPVLVRENNIELAEKIRMLIESSHGYRSSSDINTQALNI